jgi:hypothetical protein
MEILYKPHDILRLIYSLGLELLKVDSYNFLHPCDDPRNRCIFLKCPLLDTDFHMPVLHTRSVMTSIVTNLYNE